MIHIRAKLRRFAPWLVVTLFVAALGLLHHQLRDYRYHDVMNALGAIPRGKLALAGVLAVASYLLLSGYDALALAYVGRKLGYARVLFTSFTGCVLGYNIGFSVLGGTAVRYRLYTSWGLSLLQVARLVAFTVVTFWVGFCALAGGLFVSGKTILPLKIAPPFGSLQAIGAVFVVIVAAYAFACFYLQRSLTIRRWQFRLPAPRLALAQITLGAIDLAVAGGVLFVLLPEARIGYLAFLGLYLLAMIAGVVSQVPAGIGIFETVILYGLRDTVPAAEALGALLAYRVVYYLVPLGVALVLLAAHELWRRQTMVRGAATEVRRWVAQFVPPLIATTVFVGGVMLLFSGATPAVHHRLLWLRPNVPLPVLELSHFAGSIIGVGLIVLARGLQRRIDAAYGLTLALLAGGVVVSLLKGLDFEEAGILALMFGTLLPCRGYFNRRASLLNERFTTGWILAVALALGATIWLGLFSYRHVEYASDLWWQFSFRDNAPRFLRAMVGVFTALLGLALARLFRPAPPALAQPTDEDIATAGRIAAESPETHGYLALLRDKSLLLSASGASFLMYAVAGRSWIAMGNPVGDEREFPELLRRFRAQADAHGGWAVIYQAGARHLPLYLDCGFALVKLGEEARVSLRHFTIEGSARKGLRQAVHRAERDGCSFEMIPAAGLPPFLPELREVSAAWLADRNTREKGFSLGRFEEDYVRRFPVAVVRRGGVIVAFANVWCGGQHEELSIDLMRFRPEAPPGVMDYLMVELMRWGAREGYAWFNLGMAPLSGVEPDALAPMWNRIGAFIFRHGEHFYHFRGLRAYKEKFAPQWQPRYLAAPGRLALPKAVANVAVLISGGLKGVIAK